MTEKEISYLPEINKPLPVEGQICFVEDKVNGQLIARFEDGQFVWYEDEGRGYDWCCSVINWRHYDPDENFQSALGGNCLPAD